MTTILSILATAAAFVVFGLLAGRGCGRCGEGAGCGACRKATEERHG
jgi:hypothetical protein